MIKASINACFEKVSVLGSCLLLSRTSLDRFESAKGHEYTPNSCSKTTNQLRNRYEAFQL